MCLYARSCVGFSAYLRCTGALPDRGNHGCLCMHVGVVVGCFCIAHSRGGGFPAVPCVTCDCRCGRNGLGHQDGRLDSREHQGIQKWEVVDSGKNMSLFRWHRGTDKSWILLLREDRDGMRRVGVGHHFLPLSLCLSGGRSSGMPSFSVFLVKSAGLVFGGACNLNFGGF